jgi:hypothetical protein
VSLCTWEIVAAIIWLCCGASPTQVTQAVQWLDAFLSQQCLSGCPQFPLSAAPVIGATGMEMALAKLPMLNWATQNAIISSHLNRRDISFFTVFF